MSTRPEPFQFPPSNRQPRVVYLPAPKRRRSRRRFRASLILVPMTLAALMWLAQGVQSPVSWHGFITDVLHVKDTERYTMLTTLGVIIIAVIAVIRVLRTEKEDSE